MSDRIAISAKNLGKTYRLYPSVTHQVVDVLGLAPLFFWKKISFREHKALDGINVDIARGERVGIVGRNGAGKSTFLKMITENFSPSEGVLKVNGNVQALMNVGLGFHPEFSGLENIRSALTYNGIAESEVDAAIKDIVEFAELEEYLDQPMKTYSLGMQTRLMFAAATAITPDILIVDEVLGAGDSYFGVKSMHRMERLTKSGCTLLLVSHSPQQILQFCKRVLWIENGSIVMDGEALAVVKAYEEYTQKLSVKAEEQIHSTPANLPKKSIIHDHDIRNRLLEEVIGTPDSEDWRTDPNWGNIISDSGVSRWQGEGGLLISKIELKNDQEELINIVKTGDMVRVDIEVVAESAGTYPCIFALVLYSDDGKQICRTVSEAFEFDLNTYERRTVRLSYPEMLLGNGVFTFSASIYSVLDLHDPSTAKAYDLLSRSFQFEVVGPYRNDVSLVHLPSEWQAIEHNIVTPQINTQSDMMDK